MRPLSVRPERVACLLLALLFAVSMNAVAQSEHTLHSFQKGTDGSQPLAGLITDSAGNLYGTASDYGAALGTIFEMSPPTTGGAWTFTTLFTITDYATYGA